VEVSWCARSLWRVLGRGGTTRSGCTIRGLSKVVGIQIKIRPCSRIVLKSKFVLKRKQVLRVYCGGKCSINERMTAAIMNSDTRNQSTCLHSIAKHILSRFVFGNAKLTATYDSIRLRLFTKFLDAPHDAIALAPPSHQMFMGGLCDSSAFGGR
jgi:hypothetical protein